MKILLITAKIVAIAQIVLGTIHCALTPVVMKDIPAGISKVFLFMFLITGLAFIYIGLVMLREIKQIQLKGSRNLRMINLSFGLILFAGIMAIITMRENPFAWLTLIVGVCGAIVVYGKQLVSN